MKKLISRFLLWLLPEGLSRAERRRRWKARADNPVWRLYNRWAFIRCKCGCIRPRFGFCRECLRRNLRRRDACGR